MRRYQAAPQADQPAAVPTQRSGFQTVVALLPYLWPAGNPGAKVRVVVALVFMFLAKVATVYVPILYGRTVDALAPASGPAASFAIVGALIIAYGLARVGSVVDRVQPQP